MFEIGVLVRIFNFIILILLSFTACSSKKYTISNSNHVQINFKNLSINEFAEIISTIIEKEIIIEKEVKGKVNLVTNPEGIEKDKLIPLLSAILETKRMSLVNKGTHYLVTACTDEESTILKLNDIKEAMYRYILKPIDENNYLDYYFLAFKKGDESPSIIERLKDIRPKVLARSMSKVYNAKEMREVTGQTDNFQLMTRGTLIHHKENGKKGIVYTIYCVRQISDIKVIVRWGFYANQLSASESESTLLFIDGRWIVIETKQKWVS